MVARFLGDAGEFEEAETILNKARDLSKELGGGDKFVAEVFCVCMYVCMYVYMDMLFVWVCICVCVCVCVLVCVCVCVCVRVHIHTHTCTSLSHRYPCGARSYWTNGQPQHPSTLPKSWCGAPRMQKRRLISSPTWRTTPLCLIMARPSTGWASILKSPSLN